MKRKIDILTTAIPRPLLTSAIESFVWAFADRDAYHVRWLFHLDQYPGLEDEWTQTFREAAVLSAWFDDVCLLGSVKNLGKTRAVKRLFQLSESNVVFVEDDWLWKGQFWLAEVEAEVRDQGKSGYSFRRGKKGSEYCGGRGCAYLTRPPIEMLLKYHRMVKNERNAKQVLRHGGHRNLLVPTRTLQSSETMCYDIGTEWGLRNSYPGRID